MPAMAAPGISPIMQLNDWAMRHKNKVEYSLSNNCLSINSTHFTVMVTVGERTTYGIAKVKKNAKKDAAINMLELITKEERKDEELPLDGIKETIDIPTNYIYLLQMKLQRLGESIPIYSMQVKKTTDDKTIYECRIELYKGSNGWQLDSGLGFSKKSAKQDASRIYLEFCNSKGMRVGKQEEHEKCLALLSHQNHESFFTKPVQKGHHSLQNNLVRYRHNHTPRLGNQTSGSRAPTSSQPYRFQHPRLHGVPRHNHHSVMHSGGDGNAPKKSPFFSKNRSSLTASTRHSNMPRQGNESSPNHKRYYDSYARHNNNSDNLEPRPESKEQIAPSNSNVGNEKEVEELGQKISDIDIVKRKSQTKNSPGPENIPQSKTALLHHYMDRFIARCRESNFNYRFKIQTSAVLPGQDCPAECVELKVNFGPIRGGAGVVKTFHGFGKTRLQAESLAAKIALDYMNKSY